MSKKIKKIEQPKKNFQHGDQVMYTDTGIRGTVIGKSVTEKDTYIIELSNGTLETCSPSDIELVDFIRDYDNGVKQGESDAASMVEEIITEARRLAQDRSLDCGQGYLAGVIDGLADIPDLISDILDEEE